MRTIFVTLKKTLVLPALAATLFTACHTANNEVVDSGQLAADSFQLSTRCDSGDSLLRHLQLRRHPHRRLPATNGAAHP